MRAVNVSGDTFPAEFGAGLARFRINQGLTQAEVATRAGIAKRTVERLESDGTANLDTLFRVLRVLGLIDRLNQLFPRSPTSPIALLAVRGKERKRASSPRGRAPKPPSTWAWDPGA